MKNFNFHARTEILFGKGQIEALPKALAPYGKKVLLVYGGGSIKRNGVYDSVIKLLGENNFEVTELSGVEPNPRIETVRKGAKLCRDNQIEVVLAVGGGSTIDCSKVIAGACFYDGDAWDIVLDKEKITKVLPIVTVLTLAATGSEMNKNAVISKMDTNDKIGTSSQEFVPMASICDPTYMYTLPAIQTAAGTADIMSHIFENYFKSEEDTYVQDRFAEGILRACIHYCPTAIEKPDDYSARANLMWASTLALNGLTGAGKGQTWSCHPIEHELSAYYDITHGTGLAILTPRWMRYILSDKTVSKFADYGVNVFALNPDEDPYKIANKAIDLTEEFFKKIGIPMHLSELGIGTEKFDEISQKLDGKFNDAYIPMTPQDVKKILEMCL